MYICIGVTASHASLSEEEARHVFHQVLGGVSFAHNHHVIHRDLKLENLLLKENNLNFVKIADFGLSEFSRPGGTLNIYIYICMYICIYIYICIYTYI
jgi:serine/threonine protein kinase